MKKVLYATKSDIKGLDIQIKSTKKGLGVLDKALRKEIAQQGIDLRKEIAQQGVDLRKEMTLQGQQLRKEMQDMKQELCLQIEARHTEAMEAIRALAEHTDQQHNAVMNRLDALFYEIMKMREDFVSMKAIYNNHDQRIEHLEHAVFPT